MSHLMQKWLTAEINRKSLSAHSEALLNQAVSQSYSL
jgi:hypothetical protein